MSFGKVAGRPEIELAIDMMHYLLYWQSAMPPGAADANTVLRDGKVPRIRDSTHTHTGPVMSLQSFNQFWATDNIPEIDLEYDATGSPVAGNYNKGYNNDKKLQYFGREEEHTKIYVLKYRPCSVWKWRWHRQRNRCTVNHVVGI